MYALGGTRQQLSMIPTITNKGQARWITIDDAFNADKLIEFLGVLIKDSDRKISPILDNLRLHHSKLAKTWSAERIDKMELFYLPGCGPELNPEERLNADLKHAMGTKVTVRTKAKLVAAAIEHLTMIDEIPDWAKNTFRMGMSNMSHRTVIRSDQSGFNHGHVCGELMSYGKRITFNFDIFSLPR